MLCSEYTPRVLNAKSKKQIMDIVLDANGISYLQEMSDKGFPLDYDVIRKEFAAYTNGKYVATTKGKNGVEYRGSIYIDQTNPIDVNTHIVSLLNCKCDVIVPKGTCVMIFADSNCDIKVDCPNGSIAKVEYWGDAKVSSNNDDKVKIRKR